MKCTLLSKGVLLLMMPERRFHMKVLGNVWPVENHGSNKEILNWIQALLATHWVVFIKTFHFTLIPDSWNLVYCTVHGTIQISESTDVMGNSHINVLSKQVLSKWMQFQNIFFLWELYQTSDMLYVTEIAEKFLFVTKVYILIFSCYFI